MKKKAQKFSVFASIAVGFLGIMHFTNKIIFYMSTMKEMLYRGNNHHTYEWRFGKISYTKKGSGTPLLLVHDLSSTGSSYEYKELENSLAKTHTVYTIDLLGCGQSDKPKIIYTNYLYVQLISDFIKQIIQDKTTIVASRHSTGVAVMSAYIDSSLCDQLILINPSDLKTMNKYPTKKHKLLKFCFNLPIIGTFIYNMRFSKHQIAKKFSTDYFYHARPIKRYETAFCEAAHTSGSASKYVFTSIRCHYTNTNIVHALKALELPILLIQGSQVVNADRISKEYEAINSSISNVVVMNTKGMPHIENAESCCNVIQDFLAL